MSECWTGGPADAYLCAVKKPEPEGARGGMDAYLSQVGHASHTIKSNSYTDPSECLTLQRHPGKVVFITSYTVKLCNKMSTNSKFFHRKRGKDTDGLPVAYLWLEAMQLADAGACGGVAAPPYLELGTYHTTRSNATLQHTMRRTPSSQPGRRNIASKSRKFTLL